MASDEEDEELQALRLAALKSMKNKTSIEQKKEEEDLIALREAALATKKQHAIETKVQSSSPWQNQSSNSPKFVQSSFHDSFNHFNNQYQGNFRGRPRAGNSNLIVINPAPMVTIAQENPSKPTNVNANSNASLLVRPQDKWCSPDTRTNTTESKKPKTSSKFSRFDSSDSESSEHSSSSDSENEEEEKQKSPANKDDSSSDMDRFNMESDIELDEESQLINDEDTVATTKEVENKGENVAEINQEESSEPLIAAPAKNVITPTITTLPKKEIAKKTEEIKSIPAVISKKSKSACVEKVSNRWSDSDSDNATQSIHKTKVKRSWSDEGSSDDANNTKISNSNNQNLPSLKAETKKEERRREIENDLRKTLNALQSIKEKRQRQGDKKNSSSSQLDQQARSPHTIVRSPKLRTSPASNNLRKSFSKSVSPTPSRLGSPRKKDSPIRRKSRSRSPRRRRSPVRRSRSRSSRRIMSSMKRRSKSGSPHNRKKEKRALTSEERQKFEARNRKFGSDGTFPKAKKVSLKTVKHRSKSQEKISSLLRKSDSSSSLYKARKDHSGERKKPLESKENKDDNSTDSSVSSMSDSDSESDTGRSWRNEQNVKKPVRISGREREGREHRQIHDREGREHRRHSKDISKEEENPKYQNGQINLKSNTKNKLSNRSASHIYNDFIDRGFDASNYRKSKNVSDESDSDEKSKNKKLLSVVLPSGPVNSAKYEVMDHRGKVESGKSKNKYYSDRNEIVSSKKVVKRKVIAGDEEQVTKKSKSDDVCDARQLLKSKKKKRDDSCRKAVFREEHGNSISVTIKDKDDEEVISKPSVHERLGRVCTKVPSLMSLSLKPDEFMPSRILPSQDSKIVKISYDKESDYQESRKEKYKDEKKVKKSGKRRAIISDIDKRKPQSDADEDGDALEKRIQMIKEKNAAILKRQAEIQKDKERFG